MSSARNFISMQNKYDRVVLLVDMDCFYCQVEEKLDPTLVGQPVAVVQYKAWRGGGIIAVNYAARAKGVTRYMRGDEAKDQCPEIRLVKVPSVREKADLTKYREAGKYVASVLQRYTTLLERASVDEAYLDITEMVNKRMTEINTGSFVLQPNELFNTYAVGYANIGKYINEVTDNFVKCYSNSGEYRRLNQLDDNAALHNSDIRLLIGAAIANEIRASVKETTGYECSAGIAHNKIMAKLACGINKPNKQTILPLSQIHNLFETLPVNKIKGLGAKYGEEVCARMGIQFIGQLKDFTEAELQSKFDEKNGAWLYHICRGIDLEAVTPRFYSKSIGCCKKFPGRNAITGLNTLSHWLNELATEICERLEKDVIENNRRAKQMVLSYVQDIDGEDVSSSRSMPLMCYDANVLVKSSIDILRSNTRKFFRCDNSAALRNPIKFLGISVGKFETIHSARNKLQEMFACQEAKKKICNESCLLANEVRTIEADGRERAKVDVVVKADDVDGTCDDRSNHRNDATVRTAMHERNGNITDLGAEVRSFFLKAFKEPKYQSGKANEGAISKSEEDDLHELEREIELVGSERIDVDENSAKERDHADVFGDVNVIDTQRDELLPLSHSTFDAAPSGVIIAGGDSNEHKRKRLDLSETSDAASSEKVDDYRSHYVEYKVPQLPTDLLPFHMCDVCKRKIASDESSMRTHRDYHFAQELSQQQRAEFRREIATKFKDQDKAPTTAKKPQFGGRRAKAVAAPFSDITKFLRQTQSEATAVATLNNGTNDAETIVCSECNATVRRSEANEHRDYHVAKSLQRQLNQLEVHTVPVTKKSHAGSQRKSANRVSTGNDRKADAALKPITSFFIQPNS